MGGIHTIYLTNYGFTPDMAPEGEQSVVARVTAVHKERYELIHENGPCFGRLKSAVYFGVQEDIHEFPTTGDFVLIDYNPMGDSIIRGTLPRKTFFSRLDPTPGRGEQAVAANFDYVFLLQSLNKNFNLKRLERYLTLAWQSGAEPVIVLTKADLAEASTDQVLAAERLAPGVGVFPISAYTGQGIDALSPYLLPGKTLVLLGSSGVGKSSLVNALAGEDLMAVKGIREDDSQGRHTTTHRQLILLQNGVMVIDTPGMRELGMWDVSTGLNEAFADVEEFLGQCRFSDCRHQNEPGCAVQNAIAAGLLPQKRWDSYMQLKKEARYSEDKSAYMRDRQQFHKQLARQTRAKHNR